MAECTAADVQELREQIMRLQLKGKKLDFLVANMHSLCVHHVSRIEELRGAKPNITLFVDHMHFLEKNPELGEVVMDTETFDAALVKCMKEAGQ